jgi:thiamine kinase-like enzyme
VGPVALGPDIDAALAALGGEPVEAHVVGGWRAGRVTYRITLSDGQVVKVRKLRSRTRVARATALVAAVGDPRVPAALAVVGGVTVEAWVDGTILASRQPTAAEMDGAADLLADLHALAHVPGHRFRAYHSTATVLARAGRQIADLAAAGLVSPSDASQLVGRLARGLPARAARGVTHGDLRPENLVVTPSGDIVSIDNEAARIDFFAYDLGRTWCRWPMGAPQWARFRLRYLEGPRPGPEPAEELAWCIAAAVKGAHRWNRALRPNTDAPLRALARVVAELPTSG